MTPDEDIAYEMNRELGQDEQREIARRVERALTDHGDPGADLPEPRTDGGTMSDRLSEIEGRIAAATPGPWAWRNTTEPYLMGLRTRVVMAFRRMGTQGAQPQFRDEHGLLVDAGRENINAFPDADLIAHAPTDLAALVKFAREVEALRESLRRFQALRVDVNRDSILRTMDAAFQRLGGA